jgi:predicted  nucleic acid-binding Zn-ribbon protein
LKEQLSLLIELQVHDAKIQELEGTLKAFPAKFDAMQTDVRRVEQLLERERMQLTETESWRKKQESEARDQEEALIKARQRSQMVKNVKEHMASERDLETNRKNTQSREEEVARLGGAVESARTALTQHEADLETMKQHVAGEVEAAKSKMNEIEMQIATLKAEREVAAQRVDAPSLKRYSTIRMRRGMALAPVKGGTCQGCHMNIPPQLYNTLQRGITLETCPNCNRIIYWDRLFAPADGAPATKPAPVEKVAKPKAPRKTTPKAAPVASTLSTTAPARPPEPKAPKVPLTASPGSEPGAGHTFTADNLRSSSDASPDTATGPSTAPEEAAAEADAPVEEPTV